MVAPSNTLENLIKQHHELEERIAKRAAMSQNANEPNNETLEALQQKLNENSNLLKTSVKNAVRYNRLPPELRQQEKIVDEICIQLETQQSRPSLDKAPSANQPPPLNRGTSFSREASLSRAPSMDRQPTLNRETSAASSAEMENLSPFEKLQKDTFKNIENFNKKRPKTPIDTQALENAKTPDEIKQFLTTLQDTSSIGNLSPLLIQCDVVRLQQAKEDTALDPLAVSRMEITILLLQSLPGLKNDSKRYNDTKAFATQLMSGEALPPEKINNFMEKTGLLEHDAFKKNKKPFQTHFANYCEQSNAQLLEAQNENKTQHVNRTASLYFKHLGMRWSTLRAMEPPKNGAERNDYKTRERLATNANRILDSMPEMQGLGTNVSQNVSAELKKGRGTEITKTSIAEVEPIREFTTKDMPLLKTAENIKEKKASLEKDIAIKLNNNPSAVGKGIMVPVSNYLLCLQLEWIREELKIPANAKSNEAVYQIRYNLINEALKKIATTPNDTNVVLGALETNLSNLTKRFTLSNSTSREIHDAVRSITSIRTNLIEPVMERNKKNKQAAEADQTNTVSAEPAPEAPAPKVSPETTSVETAAKTPDANELNHKQYSEIITAIDERKPILMAKLDSEVAGVKVTPETKMTAVNEVITFVETLKTGLEKGLIQNKALEQKCQTYCDKIGPRASTLQEQLVKEEKAKNEVVVNAEVKEKAPTPSFKA